MRTFVIWLGTVLTLFAGHGGLASTAPTDRLVAIDVLLLPDAAMAAKALAANARLLRNYRAGFALDATHTPHLTLLQCYVHAGDLAAAKSAVNAVFRHWPPEGMNLIATGYFNSRIADVSATGIAVRVTPPLARLQREIVAAVAPFMRHGGTAAAFVDAPKSATIDWTAGYVDTFVPKASGPNFSPHVTAGIGRPDFVARLTAEPFTEFNFKVIGAGVYQLGDIGTARKRLWGGLP
jgi:hypothetical protein